MSRKKKRDRRRPSRRSVQKLAPARDVALDLDEEWGRAGSRNIAGVSFQVAVTLKLLIDARLGKLDLASLTPEGFDDIDLQFRDGERALVQVKDRTGTFGRSDLADELKKKRVLLTEDPDRGFILATDAPRLGGGLDFGDWTTHVTRSMPQADLDALADLLTPAFDDPRLILERTRLLRGDRDVAAAGRRDLAEIRGVEPSVAGLVYSRLVEVVTEIAARQRETTPRTARWLSPTDVDAFIKRVVETVDLAGLDEAVRIGLVEPLDFTTPTQISIEEFLAGVDVLPAHIAAQLDLPRPDELREVTRGLDEQHAVLLVGPSGSGKSALMWEGRTRAGRSGPSLPAAAAALRRCPRAGEMGSAPGAVRTQSAPSVCPTTSVGLTALAGVQARVSLSTYRECSCSVRPGRRISRQLSPSAAPPSWIRSSTGRWPTRSPKH